MPVPNPWRRGPLVSRPLHRPPYDPWVDRTRFPQMPRAPPPHRVAVALPPVGSGMAPRPLTPPPLRRAHPPRLPVPTTTQGAATAATAVAVAAGAKTAAGMVAGTAVAAKAA